MTRSMESYPHFSICLSRRSGPRAFLVAWLWLVASISVASESGLTGTLEQQIDSVAKRAMETWNVPGMAIGVVKDGKTVYSSGHGVRAFNAPAPVDADTLFRIASASKAFTSAALAVLVESGSLSWDSPVVEHIPELRFSDPWVTANITVTDLLAHRSGLMAHAGDLLLWPVPNAFTRQDVIQALRHFPIERGFRAGYSYENLLYIVAGEIVARETGTPWGSYVDQNIMQPLGMRRCFAGPIPEQEMINLAVPHGEVDGRLKIIDRNRIPRQPTKFAPAGGVVCSLSGMLNWLQLQLGRGTHPQGVQLFSPGQSEKVWAPHNLLDVSQSARELHGTLFRAYGLGWRIRDVFGYREISHTGSLDGWRAHVLMVPELELGIVVMSNGSSSAARSAVMYTIEHGYLPAPERDWVSTYLEMERAAEQEQVLAEAALPETPAAIPSLPQSVYAGRYHDPWFGEVLIERTESGLWYTARKSPRLSGPMRHHSGHVFVVEWSDRSLELDAFVRFHVDELGQVPSMTMKRIVEPGSGDPDHFKLLEFSRAD